MFRQVGIGAATVLSIGLLAAGCSEDGDTIIAGGGSILSNTDSTPFSGVQNNNLANDGGGFTGNGADWANWAVKFNCDSPKSSATSTADGSAIVLYRDTNNRVFASHFANGSFTPPVELQASDKSDGTAPSIDSYVMIPLNTGNYQTGTQNPPTEVNTVRQQAGNWLIIGDFQTQFVQQGQSIDSASSIGKGQRRTLGSWVFLNSLRDQSFGTSAAVGGTTREFRYGFQRFAEEIPTTHVAGGIGSAPANNVISYGAATDGLAGQAVFGGNGTPHSGGFTGTSVYSAPAPTFDDAQYTVGDDVSVIAAVYTQIESSLSSDNNDLRPSALNAATSTGGQAFMRYRAFNLATLSWGTEARLSTGIRSNNGSEASRAGEGVFPDFGVYNNTVFFRYMDASQRTNNTTTFATNTKDIQANRVMIAAARFVDNGSGGVTVTNPTSSGNALDISTDTFCRTNSNGAGTPGAHTTTQATGATGIVAPSYEFANFIAFNNDPNSTSVYGDDEGLEEISLFYTLDDNTASGTGTTGSGPNADSELAVVAINKTGALSGSSSFVAGTNPLRISGNHATDNQAVTSSGSTTNVQLADGILGTSFVMNRTGRWIGAAFRRRSGVGESNAFSTNLWVTVYQPFRLVTSSTGGAAGGTAANMENRVAGPTQINGSISINAAAANGNSLPVNRQAFQGGACYRGLQSDANAISIFYEQSDGTGDRVFGAKLSVTLSTANNPATAPTVGTVTPVELTFANNVLADAAFITTGGGPGTSSFEWMNGNGLITDSNHWQSVDAGGDQGSSTATNGNVLIVFSRVDDATTTDSGTNDLGDVSLYATTFNGTAFEAPVKIGTTADTQEAIGGIAAANNIRIDDLVAVPNNTNISQAPNFPTNSGSGYYVVLMKDREATLNTASGATTTTVLGGNSTTRIAQFARRISTVNSSANPAVTAIADRVFPSVNNSSTSPFALPIQLDHAQGVSGDAGFVRTCHDNSAVAVVLVFDNQIWYQATQDGENWLRDGSTGLSNPGLISNYSSADIVGAPELYCCQDDEGKDGAAILLYNKRDFASTKLRGFAAARN